MLANPRSAFPQKARGRHFLRAQPVPRRRGRGHPPGRRLQVVLPEEFLLIVEQLQFLHQVLHHHEHVVGRAGPPLHDHLPRPFAAGPRYPILQTRRRDHGRGGRHRKTHKNSSEGAPAHRARWTALQQPGPPRSVTKRPPGNPSPGQLDSASFPPDLF